jgi:hypothetical protein
LFAHRRWGEGHSTSVVGLTSKSETSEQLSAFDRQAITLQVGVGDRRVECLCPHYCFRTYGPRRVGI